MRHVLLALAVVLAACGPANNTKPDAGPDTSCGIDCAAQNRYGLIVNRCFEYSNDTSNKHDPPDLGVLVLPVAKLEGDVSVLPVEYRERGQIVMRDNFMIKSGSLYLARREFRSTSTTASVTYRDAAPAIVGAKWLNMDTGPNESFDSDVQALVMNRQGVGTTEATTYRVTTADATLSELRTPLMTYDGGVKMLVGETLTGTTNTASHGSDPRRVFVPDVGFVVIVSPFSVAGGTPTPLSIQKIRQVGAPDAGADCSLGVP